MNWIEKLFSPFVKGGESPVVHKSFLLVEPFEGELVIEDESDNSNELYKRMDLGSLQRVITREEYEYYENQA